MEKSSNEEMEKSSNKESIDPIKLTLKKLKMFLVLSDNKIDGLASRVSAIEKRLDEKLADREKIKTHLLKLNKRLDALEKRLDVLKNL